MVAIEVCDHCWHKMSRPKEKPVHGGRLIGSWTDDATAFFSYIDQCCWCGLEKK